MSFLAPWAWFFALLAAPIIVFYILKIRLRRIPVATTLFWQQVFDEKLPRSLWQKLRHLLSLLAQLLFLIALVLALSQPLMPWEAAEARRVILILDNSASMNADDVKPTRLAAAKEKALQAVSHLRHFDEAAVLTAGTAPQVACGLTSHSGTLQAAIKAIPATDGPTHLMATLDQARRLVADLYYGRWQILVFTDACSDEATAIHMTSGVQLIPIGTTAANLGITRFQVRRSLQDPLGYEILTEVHNASDDPLECRLELDLGGEVIDVVPIKLAANDTYRKVFAKTSAAGGALTAKLNHTDALAADNQAQAILPTREQQPVILVTAGNLFLRTVLAANPLVKLTVTSKVPEQVPPGTVLVLHRQDVKTLPAGNVMVVDPVGASDLWQFGGVVQHPIVARQEKDHPLMAHVRLDNVLMPEAKVLTPVGSVERSEAHRSASSFAASPGKPQVLASAANGEPLLLAWERPSGKLFVLTVNLDQGDLPLRTAFPIIMLNTLAWFAGSKGELHEARSTGDLAEMTISPVLAASEPALVSPTGQRRLLPSSQEKVTLGPLDQVGVWKIEPGPKQTHVKPIEVACNLGNRRESDLRPSLTVSDVSTSFTSGSWGPYWFRLLVLATALIALEWVLYQRRWIS